MSSYQDDFEGYYFDHECYECGQGFDNLSRTKRSPGGPRQDRAIPIVITDRGWDAPTAEDFRSAAPIQPGSRLVVCARCCDGAHI